MMQLQIECGRVSYAGKRATLMILFYSARKKNLGKHV